MNIIKVSFNIIEFTFFILPALPNNLYVRLSILLFYFILHYFRVQKIYSEIKNKYIRDYSG